MEAKEAGDRVAEQAHEISLALVDADAAVDEAKVLAAHEQNRRSWNMATPAHQSHKRSQADFFRNGGSTLFPEEVELLGSLDGLSVVHLQCNCGQDTLSLLRLGAAHVVGVDISDAAIAEAQQLSVDTGLAADFERDDVLLWLDKSRNEKFDVVFTSYGVLGWLGDLRRWARGISGLLKPGGRLVLVEFHPLAWSFRDGGTLTGDPYFIDAPGGRCDEPGGVSDYVASSGDGLIPEGMGWAQGECGFSNPEPTIEYQHTVGDIVTALSAAGLFIRSMREYPFSNGCQMFGGMRPLPGRRFAMPEGLASVPLMLSITAEHR
mmetsp:Transcript_45872/g.120277  ORF Transcript_45872/g.120277 Transcript_45872/m.120277 type:complete len:320 (+) Transcript_45872:65-1024(+)|eukprot:CAMPEP_0115846666 /NCGR_PEP_ID=MMETSP0287-20121206/9977_1 /TAXON_ID=412157 /ORGANISM="Chrysochromulina rotalis, Strain UIO044" /LENGTH=319 /DNA_ID=CAMNT_0003300461 /DNA_START=60 /DNA_END=1019 /DNA_ORIENTATION=+